jgi:hypothetical protein
MDLIVDSVHWLFTDGPWLVLYYGLAVVGPLIVGLWLLLVRRSYLAGLWWLLAILGLHWSNDPPEAKL